MIVTNLHKEPIALDTVLHRDLRLKNELNAIPKLAPFTSFMVSVSEFADAALNFPILFVRAAPDALGRDTVAPVAVFGLKPGENLFAVDGKWDAGYVPAMLRAYPFTMARIEGSDRWAMVFDNSWEGMSRTEGLPLFNEKGEASELLNGIHKFVQDLETDLERTRQACAALLEMKLLKPMRFDATLASGEALSVDGFMTADEEAIAKLPDAQIASMYRNGLLGLLQIHTTSLNNMRRLLDRRLIQGSPEARAAAEKAGRKV
jgi:SapC